MARETINNAESGLSVRTKLNDNFIELYAGAGSESLPNGTVSLPAVRAAADQDTGMFFPAANTVAVATGGSERMRITSAGNVGIGTSSPTGRLHASLGASGAVPVGGFSAAVFDSNTDTGISILTPNTSIGSIAFGDPDNGAVGRIRYLHNSDVMSFNTAGAERMRITSAGNVGIGETAPDYKLDVNGTFGFTPGASVTPVDNGDVVFELTDNTTLTIKAKGSDGVVRSGTITLA